MLYTLARRLSDAVEQQACAFSIQEATMAFEKTMMTLQGVSGAINDLDPTDLGPTLKHVSDVT
jgi:hypothetical protein